VLASIQNDDPILQFLNYELLLPIQILSMVQLLNQPLLFYARSFFIFLCLELNICTFLFRDLFVEAPNLNLVPFHL